MDFKIKKTQVAVEYSLSVEKEIFTKIINKDSEADKQLFEQLMELDGISEVDYDYHYGSQLYVTLDPEYDYSSTWFAVYKIMDDYIKNEKEI